MKNIQCTETGNAICTLLMTHGVILDLSMLCDTKLQLINKQSFLFDPFQTIQLHLVCALAQKYLLSQSVTDDADRAAYSLRLPRPSKEMCVCVFFFHI